MEPSLFRTAKRWGAGAAGVGSVAGAGYMAWNNPQVFGDYVTIVAQNPLAVVLLGLLVFLAWVVPKLLGFFQQIMQQGFASLEKSEQALEQNNRMLAAGVESRNTHNALIEKLTEGFTRLLQDSQEQRSDAKNATSEIVVRLNRIERGLTRKRAVG